MGDAAQEALLRVQEHDTHLDQLHHRRITLPERGQLRDVEARLAALGAELEAVRGRHGELERSQRRLEDETAMVEDKAREIDRRMYSGTVTAPRELQTMQEEVASLKRRQSSLEDQLLEVMELTEPVVADLERLDGDRAAAEVERARLEEAITAAESEITSDIARVEAERAELTAGVAPDLLATYERLRPKLDGVAIARLEGNRCLGCHLTLPATEVDQIRRLPPDAVVRHEECGRILVR